MNNEIKFIFDKLFAFYKVATITDLAQCLGLSQPTVTNWQRRNSINAIKKRCRELGIYDEIFGDLQKIKSIDDLKIENSKNDIQITTINDKRILYFFETLFKDCKLNNKLKELEDDIKNLIIKYNPKISIDKSKKTTTDLFFEFLEKNIN